jgi:hypothetical protein
MRSQLIFSQQAKPDLVLLILITEYQSRFSLLIVSITELLSILKAFHHKNNESMDRTLQTIKHPL